MSAVTPSLLRPAYTVLPWFSPRIWGSLDLSLYYPQRGRESEPIGEAWLTADHCRVSGMPDVALSTLVRDYPGHLFSPGTRPFDHFPVLVKFLFPRDRLSVQVHPDDAYAARHGMGRGKTEMWYVVAAELGARLGIGLAPGASIQDFSCACREGRGAELLRWFEVHAGETIFIPAGTIHAIGPGVVLCEVQQQSDNTFRLDDYGRRDAQGRLRELHLDHGFAVARPELGGRIESGLANGGSGLLVECPYFRVERLVHEGREERLLPEGEFSILANMGGAAHLRCGNHEESVMEIPPAHAMVIPAAAPSWRLTGPAQFLRVTIPEETGPRQTGPG